MSQIINCNFQTWSKNHSLDHKDKIFRELYPFGIISKVNFSKELINKDQKAFLALKIVEIIGEDEPYQLDPETIFFVTNLLNKMNLVTIRNKVLNSALPLRT